LKSRLPLVSEGEELRFKSIEPEQHFTRAAAALSTKRRW